MSAIGHLVEEKTAESWELLTQLKYFASLFLSKDDVMWHFRILRHKIASVNLL